MQHRTETIKKMTPLITLFSTTTTTMLSRRFFGSISDACDVKQRKLFHLFLPMNLSRHYDRICVDRNAAYRSDDAMSPATKSTQRRCRLASIQFADAAEFNFNSLDFLCYSLFICCCSIPSSHILLCVSELLKLPPHNGAFRINT